MNRSRDIDYYVYTHVKERRSFHKGFDSFTDSGDYSIWGNQIADINYNERRITFCKCGYDTDTTKRRLNDIADAVIGGNAVYFQIVKKVLVMRDADADTDEILDTGKVYPVVGLDDETWFIQFRERW